MGELLERWFDQAKEDFSPKTVKETRGLLDRYLLPGLGHVGLHKLKADALDRWYRSLCAKGGHAGRPLAPAAVRRIHGVLRRAWARACAGDGWPSTRRRPPRHRGCRCMRRAGLSGIHDLRHYVATRLLSMGVDVRTVAGRLGHRNASTTLNVYSHFLTESDRDAANVLGRLFDDAVEKAKV